MPAASINNVIGKRFIELLSVDSTNNYAMRQLQNGSAKHGDAYFAFEQTAGKGQFDKQWLSAKTENIILSIVIDTKTFLIQQQFILNMITAISLMELFNNYTDKRLKIKWANDIYYNDRKAAGILIENIIRGNKWQWAVIGFGININQTNFPATLKNPVSLKQITGNNYNVTDLSKELCGLLDKNLQLSKNTNIVLEKYNAALYKRNELVQLKQGSKIFSGIVKEVDSSGRLIIKGEKEIAIKSGSVEWILSNGRK